MSQDKIPSAIQSDVMAAQPGPERAFLENDFDFLGLLRTLWRGKWIIMICAIVGVCIAIWQITNLAVPTYLATASVALESREAQVVDIESVVSGLSGDQASINTEVEVLRSRKLLSRVASQMNLMELPEFNPALREEPYLSMSKVTRFLRGLFTGEKVEKRVLTPEEQQDKVIDELGSALSVNNIRQSYVYRITATTQSPDLSRDIANAMAELYLQSQLEAKFEATQRATSWLTERVADLQIELEDAEQTVKDFSVETDLVGPDVLEAQERQVKEIRDRTTDTSVALNVSQKRFTEITEAANDPRVLLEITNDPTIRRLLNSGLGAADPAYLARRDQIVASAQAETTRLQGQLTALETSLAELVRKNADQADDLVELRQLTREAEASRLIYEYFLSRLKETSVQQGIQQADSRILSLAVSPLQKATPRSGMQVMLFAILGAMLGSLFLIFRELTQSTFRTAEILEQDTGYQVIGQTPLVPVRKRSKLIEYLHERPASAAAEAIRNLRTTLLLQDIDNPPRVILSTSSVPGEGKTTQSIGLAINLAAMDQKILLIEGDIRRRVFAEYFDIDQKQGLVSLLRGTVDFEDVVHSSEKYGLDILPGETSSTNAADLYSSKRFRTVLEGLKEKYDLIVIDTPPVLAVPDARIISQNVDAIVYSVKWDDTPKAQVRRGLRQFESVGVRVSGLVLSQIDPKGMKGYGYSSYGSSEYYQK